MRDVSHPPQPSASTAHPHPDLLQPACEHLRAGGLVILPTDTVYGIGCDAAEAGAVERLLRSPIFCFQRQKQPKTAVVLFAFLCSEKNAQKDIGGRT